jgi:hypothetical protein
MFKLASTEGRFVRKVFRPCVLDENDFKKLLDEEGIRYVIITDPIREYHKQNTEKIDRTPQLYHLTDVKNKNTMVTIYENINYRLSETKCNYICILKEWICLK